MGSGPAVHNFKTGISEMLPTMTGPQGVVWVVVRKILLLKVIRVSGL